MDTSAGKSQVQVAKSKSFGAKNFEVQFPSLLWMDIVSAVFKKELLTPCPTDMWCFKTV